MTMMRRCGLAAALLLALAGTAAPPAHGHSYTTTLSVTKSGPGTVVDDLGQISCGADCSGTYNVIVEPIEGTSPPQHSHEAEQPTLTATPSSGTVVDWGGACETETGTTCVLDMSASRSVSVTFVDQTDPTVSLTAPANGSRVRGTVNLSAAANDNVGVQRVEFLRDSVRFASDTTSPYVVPLDTTVLSDGMHTIGARAFDTASRSSATSTRVITVDNTGPAITFTGGPADGAAIAQGTTPTYTFTASDFDVDAVECHLQGRPFEDCASGSSSFPGLPAGSYVFEIRATDGLGNVATATRQLVVSAQPPPRNDDSGRSTTTPTTTTATTTGSFAGGVTTSGPLPEVLERIRRSFRVSRRGTRIAALTIEVIDGAKVVTSCRGRGCAIKRRSVRVRDGVANIAALFGRRRTLRPGAQLIVNVTAPDGRVETLRIVVRRAKQPKVTEA